MLVLIDNLIMFLSIAIFARVILSWFPHRANNPIITFIYAATEPILAPIRRYMPRFGMLDLSPMIALVLIFLVRELLTFVLA